MFIYFQHSTLGPYLKQTRFVAVAFTALCIYLVAQDLPYNLGLIVASVGAVAAVKLFALGYKRATLGSSA